MKPGSGTITAAIAALVEIGAGLYFLTTANDRSAPLVSSCILIHTAAAIVCALAGAAVAVPVDRPAPGSRAALFVFFVIPAILLPAGGVLTVLAMAVILRSKPVPREADESEHFSTLESPAASARPAPVLEPFSGMLRSASLQTCRAMASGLRSTGVSRPEQAARLLRRLQQHPDTETRFRAQGSLSRIMRGLEARLKTEYRAEACVALSRWSHATGANRETLLENAVDTLRQAVPSGDIHSLNLLAGALLAQGNSAEAGAAICRLRDARASREMLDPLEAELLFLQGKWEALAAHCASMGTSNPSLLENIRFWAANPAAGAAP